jgi:hypothetical protein
MATWSQTVDEAIVRLPIPADVLKADIRLTSLPRKLQVSIRRQVVCDVQLHAEVEHEVRIALDRHVAPRLGWAHC